MNTKQRLDLAFAQYDSDYPEIYRWFVHVAKRTRNAGFETYGAKAIMEVVRWNINMKAYVYDKFKINNNFISRYARKMQAEYPQFAGFFRNRRLHD